MVRDPHGDEWGVVLRSPHLRQVLGELKALQALRDSGLPEALGLGVVILYFMWWSLRRLGRNSTSVRSETMVLC